MPDNNYDAYDWVETAVKAGRRLGLNPVRTRWKLRRLQDRLQSRKHRLESQRQALTRDHRTCLSCGAINAAEDRVCHQCGAKLPPRPVELAARVVRRFGLEFGPEILIAVGFCGLYLLLVVKSQSSGWFSIGYQDLIRLGGNFYPLTAQGQWWRLWTCVFLHAGLWHLGFNTGALLYLMPQVREEYGSSKTLFVFVLTGVGASALSFWWGMQHQAMGVGIGGSGALCGLIGLTAAWGHRQGAGLGLAVRNHMLRWALYTLGFGLMVHADNVAHLGGLVLGAVLAYVLPARSAPGQGRLWTSLGVLSAAAVLAALAWITCLAFFGPTLSFSPSRMLPP